MMTTKNPKPLVEQAFKDSIETGQKAVRAGIGASSSSVEYAVQSFDKRFEAANTFVNDLIARGEKVEVQLTETLGLSRLADALESTKTRVFSMFGTSEAKQGEQLDNLAVRVDDLLASVEALTQKKLAAAKKSAPVKAAPAKPVAKKEPVKKAPVKKAVKKPAAKPVAKPRAKQAAKKTAE